MQFRAEVIDENGRLLGYQEFSANDHHGHQALLTWMREHDIVSAIGVETTGSGAALTRMLTTAGEHVTEVGRLNTPSNVTTADDKTTSTGTFWNR